MKALPAFRLLEDGSVGATADPGGEPRAPVVDDLGAHRGGRQQATHQAPVIGQPRLDRPVVIAVAQRLTPIVADVLADDNFAVVAADDALPIRQLDQDGGHQPF